MESVEQPIGDKPTRDPPVLSVISIFYNAGEFISEALESVLGQDFQDFELILVDDGSTDEGTSIAREYAERDPARIRYVQHPGGMNCGMSASRNLGLKAARGEFIAFIDADDRWKSTKLREQLAIFERIANIDAVCGSVNYWRSCGGQRDKIVPTGHAPNAIVSPPKASLRWYPLGRSHAPSMSDLLLRASSIRAVGGFEDAFPGPYEDQAFLAKFYLCSSIYVSSAVWSDYRIHDKSCMALTAKERRYDEARSYFLHWFRQYLQREATDRHPEVAAAVDHALRPHRNPLRLAGKVLRRLGGA